MDSDPTPLLPETLTATPLNGVKRTPSLTHRQTTKHAGLTFSKDDNRICSASTTQTRTLTAADLRQRWINNLIDQNI